MKKKTEQNAAGAPQKGKTAGAGAAGFLKKNWKWLVPVACVAVLGGVWLLKPKADKPASVDTSYVETVPEQRDLVNALSGTGTLKPANTYNVKSLVSGKVLTCSFEEGDNVEEGDVLYTVDSSDATTKAEQAGITLQQAQRNYDKTVDRQYVRAEVAGVVSSLKVAKGDEVTSGQEVAVIRDNSKMTLALEFPAADAAGFSVGQSADVTLDGTFETMTGTITAVTGTDALSTGNLLTRTVTISVRNAGGLTTAQAATATVNGVSSIGAATFQYQAERTLTTLAAGTVTAIHAREGDSVNKDDIVLQISGDDLSESIQSASETLRGAELSMQSTQDTMNNYTITSPISGTIIEKAAKVGDALSTGSDLCTIYDLSYLEMTIKCGMSCRSAACRWGRPCRSPQTPCRTGPMRRCDPRVHEGRHQRRHHHLPGHRAHRRDRRPAPRHERQRGDRGGPGQERTGGAQRSRGARQLCAGDPGLSQCGQRRPGHGRTGRLCVRQGQAGRQ